MPALWLPTPACVTNNQAFVEALAGLRPTTLLVGLCSGAWLVAASGRLDGREATTHWALAERLQQCYPRVRVQADSNLTHDGNLICSGGATAALDACLHLAQLLGGPALARQLARLLVTHTRHGPQTRYAPSYGLRPHADGAIEQVERLIRERHADTLSLEALAAAIHVSARTLQRRFLVATGMTPMQYQQRVRVEAAKARLAQSDQTIERVARAVGYEDRVAFARLFRKVTGQTPGAYRQLARELPADAGARQK